jgi:4-amino-4-deoxy-L-arabinose transferase-like glycosyltransferase
MSTSNADGARMPLSQRATMLAALRPRPAGWPRGVLRTWRRIPRAGRACALIAFANVAIWSVIIPPFMVPDEVTHFGYAQYLAETGKAPPQAPLPAGQFSPQEDVALTFTGFYTVIGHQGDQLNRGIYTQPEQKILRHAISAQKGAVGQGGVSTATNQPPLYYALEAVPYWLSPSNNILTRLVFMRLLSALLAAGTVLAIFLFLRELLPGTPWSWTVGALMVAFQPTFAFIGAGVNNDNLLYLASAMTFLALARAWRRGLTMRRAAIIGGVLAIGMLSKLTFLALVPGAGIALLLLVRRDLPGAGQRAYSKLTTAIAVAAAPVAVYALLNVTVWHRGSPLAGGLTSVTSGSGPVSAGTGWHAYADYAWELFLPRLPFMNHVYFRGGYPLWTLWLNGSIGHFGWLDYVFPSWVYADMRWVVYVLAGLAVIATWRLRHRIRPLLGLFASFGAITVGLLAVIGYLSAQAFASGASFFPQARYLFPLLPLYALGIVLATKALPRRWAVVLGALLVALAFAHNLFAETLTISRYYG